MMLLWNIFLAAIWAAVTGQVTVLNLLVGFALGHLVLWIVQRAVGPTSSYFRKVRQVLGFAVFYLWELILANLRVAYDVVTPTHHMRPGTIAIPLDARTDVEITMVANLITLTPGTLSLDVSSDRRVLYIHAMYIDDVERVRRRIKRGVERRVLEVLR
ncbi:MAG: Na+/H+ antiporter subunit E [Armatimonadota bacterium]|nr:Na+/H+ antiporter subunit E [Armatimonadota bacterium]MDR7401107.1 Na+/H+ antiporter subunit E [Armatimonadota bacterium]MDR7403541.1 Na+/H+ antiporter subunit E [Armatimonadota bacterium]MDR7436402.1 Na+/H+ antiporter subunit E [Armatimonadota bacterium]MDR7471759.1 Na+/H+ antiporter subunit E [Armatimonadota bacterium]